MATLDGFGVARRREGAGAHAMVRSRVSAVALAGALMVSAAAVFFLGVMTAEALYPDVYTTHDNEISDLGATRPPDSIIRQPSARIFNGTMVLVGVLLLGSVPGVHRQFGARRATIPVALLGLGVLGVGIFSGNRAPMHGMFALLAFVSGGLCGVLLARYLAQPFQWVSRAFGIVSLASLGVAFLAEATPLWDELGDGGVERWVAFPVVLWLASIGGYLMGVAGREPARPVATREP